MGSNSRKWIQIILAHAGIVLLMIACGSSEFPCPISISTATENAEVGINQTGLHSSGPVGPLSQSFTLTKDASVQQVHVYLSKSLAGMTSGWVTLYLSQGNTPGPSATPTPVVSSTGTPTSYASKSATIATISSDTDPGFIKFAFDDGYSLSKDTLYWISLVASSGHSSGSSLVKWHANTDDPHPEGNAQYRISSTSSYDNAGMAGGNNQDFLFRIQCKD